MPRRNVDTSKLEQLAKDFYQRSEISDLDDTIKGAAIKGIQETPVTTEELFELGGQVSTEEYFGRTGTKVDKAR